ncbi:hypothetical protein QBC44DRAFT_306252 [Cladorrhinum sp. PSN332]|nr:hypothetical protein QBC44DRAFT_306252 [Cladorrhinum sp. PSN332]
MSIVVLSDDKNEGAASRGHQGVNSSISKVDSRLFGSSAKRSTKAPATKRSTITANLATETEKIPYMQKKLSTITNEKAELEVKLDTEKAAFANQSRSFFKQITDRTSQIALLKEKVADQSQQNLERLEVISVLKRELAALQSKQHHTPQHKVSPNSKQSGQILENKLQSQITINESLSAANRVFRENVARVSAELFIVKTKLAKESESARLAVSKTQNLQNELQGQTKKVVNNRKVSSAATARVQDLERQLHQQTDEAIKGRELAKAATETNKELEKRLQQQIEENIKERDATKAAAAKNEDLEKQLAKQMEENAALKTRHSTVHQKALALTHHLNERTAKAKMLKKELIQTRAETERVKEQCEEAIQNHRRALLVADRDVKNSRALLKLKRVASWKRTRQSG